MSKSRASMNKFFAPDQVRSMSFNLKLSRLEHAALGRLAVVRGMSSRALVHRAIQQMVLGAMESGIINEDRVVEAARRRISE